MHIRDPYPTGLPAAGGLLPQLCQKGTSMSEQRKYRIGLFGATGFTGGLCAEYLAQQLPDGTAWAIAGRNEQKLEAVRERLSQQGTQNLPGIIVADVEDPASLERMAADCTVVITTVGPYVYYGEPVVRACVEQGTHYCDLVGEPEFVNNMICNWHDRARETGAAIVNCCGFDSIPHDAGVLFTIRALEEACGGPLEDPVEVEGVVTASGTFSGGTWQSAITAFGRPRENRDAIRRARPLIEHHYPKKVGSLSQRPRYDRELGGWLCPMPTIDPVVVQRSARARPEYGPEFRYGHYMQTRGLARMIGGIAGVGGLLVGAQIGPVRRRLLQYRQSGEGPPKEKRERSWFRVRFRGRCAGQEVLCEVAGGDPGYEETARMLSESAMSLAMDEGMPLETGVVTPVMALGDRLVERLRAAGIRFERLR